MEDDFDINKFLEDFISLQEDLPEEFQKVIDDNFWDLVDESERRDMLFPKPIDCSCGNEMSWASSIENFSMKESYYAVVCSSCGKKSGIARTEINAARKWNDDREIEIDIEIKERNL